MIVLLAGADATAASSWATVETFVTVPAGAGSAGGWPTDAASAGRGDHSQASATSIAIARERMMKADMIKTFCCLNGRVPRPWSFSLPCCRNRHEDQQHRVRL